MSYNRRYASIETIDREFARLKAQDQSLTFAKFSCYESLNHIEKHGSHATLGKTLDRHNEWEVAGLRTFQRYRKLFDIKPESQLIDYGCGSLRVGFHFIRFLEERKYIGVDIIDHFYKIGVEMIGTDLMAAKAPQLYTISAQSVEYAAASNPDFIYSSAVAFHVHPDESDCYFKNLQRIAHNPNCTLFFDVVISDQEFRYSGTSWARPLSYFKEKLSELHFLNVKNFSAREVDGKMIQKAVISFKRV